MINPDTLKHLLAKQGLSQAELARRSKVHKQTVSRICTGESGRPDKNTICSIAKALQVDPAELSKPVNDAVEAEKILGVSRLDKRIHNCNHNALALVAHRYGVSVRTIIELAPALFTLTAEQHLANRRSDLSDVQSALDVAEQKAPKHILLCGAHMDDVLAFEENAIKRRDLFLDQCDDPDDALNPLYEFDTHAPYPLWLKNKLQEVGYSGEVQWSWRDSEPRFTAAVDDAVWLTNGDLELAEAIVKGDVALSQLQKDERTAERRLAGLRRLHSEHIQRAADRDAFFAELFPELSNSVEVKP